MVATLELGNVMAPDWPQTDNNTTTMAANIKLGKGHSRILINKKPITLHHFSGCGSSVVARRLAVRKATGSFPDPTKRASCVLLIMKTAVYSSGWANTVNRICLGRPSPSSSRGRQIGTWLPLIRSMVAGGKSDGLL